MNSSVNLSLMNNTVASLTCFTFEKISYNDLRSHIFLFNIYIYIYVYMYVQWITQKRNKIMFFTTWLNQRIREREKKDKRHGAVNVMHVKEAATEIIV